MKIASETSGWHYSNFNVSEEWPEMTNFTIVDFSAHDKDAEIVYSTHLTEESIKFIENNLPDELHFILSRDNFAQIMHKDATKAKAVAELAKIWNISPTEIVAFGDDLNGIDMLKYVGVGVAMGNALPAVKAVADLICDTNENDGVAKWLEENVLCEDFDAEIRPLIADDLPQYADIIRYSFATVAKDFGWTRENAPGHVSFRTDEQFASRVKVGYFPFGLFISEKIIGFVALTDMGDGAYKLSKLAVLPEWRHYGYGKRLLDFCKEKVRDFGGKRITLSIVEEITVLKNWYLANGFVHFGANKFEYLPFAKGYMEWQVTESSSDCPLLGLAADSSLTVDSFRAMTHDKVEIGA